MLVLTRKRGESIHIGSQIEVTVLQVRGNTVRLGIKAPDQVRIMRAEIDEWGGCPINESDLDNARQNNLVLQRN